MTRLTPLIVFLLAIGVWSCTAQQNPPATRPSPATAPTTRRIENHDESKVISFTLPDALTLENGQPVTDADTWYKQRRPELLEIFRREVYGRDPGRPDG